MSVKKAEKVKNMKGIKKEQKKISLKIGIRTKLLIVFLLPVTALILLGILSYSQTANAIRNLYQSSSIQILGKSADYLEVLMLDVETTAYDLSVDNDLVNYFSGMPDEGVDYSLVDAKVASMLGTDAYVENGYFIAIEGNEHIRRYPDLQIHRIIKEQLRGRLKEKRIEHYTEKLPDVAKHSSKMERRAEEAERETDKLKKVEYMEERIGEVYEGVISGITQWGIYVELPNTVEGLIHVASLPGDYFNYDENAYEMVGQSTGKTYKLGERIRIQVKDVDRFARTIDFGIPEE